MTVTTTAGMTAALAKFVADTSYEDLPEEAIANTKLAMLDTVACALAAARIPVGSIMIEHVRAVGGAGGSAVWAGGYRTSAPMAAYANGHLANALDYDLSLHLDTHVMPAAFAIGEERGVNGRTLLESYIVSREVGARLMDALDGGRWDGHGVTHRGWWHVGLVAPLDAALVTGRLLGLDAETIAAALGIASSTAGGFRRNMGTMTKSLHSGNGARGGVEAAQLAARGFTGDPGILEAPMGYISTLCPESGEFNEAAVYDGLGARYNMQNPPKVKPFPACGPANAQIDSVRELLRDNHFVIADVDRIVVNTHPLSLFRPEARNALEASFSTPYILAATLLDGEFGMNQLTEERVHDATVRKLMEKVEHDADAPDRRITVQLNDGREIVAETDSRRTLRTWDEVAEKFDACVETRLTPSAAAEFKAALAALETMDNVAELMKILHDGACS